MNYKKTIILSLLLLICHSIYVCESVGGEKDEGKEGEGKPPQSPSTAITSGLDMLSLEAEKQQQVSSAQLEQILQQPKQQHPTGQLHPLFDPAKITPGIQKLLSERAEKQAAARTSQQRAGQLAIATDKPSESEELFREWLNHGKRLGMIPETPQSRLRPASPATGQKSGQSHPAWNFGPDTPHSRFRPASPSIGQSEEMFRQWLTLGQSSMPETPQSRFKPAAEGIGHQSRPKISSAQLEILGSKNVPINLDDLPSPAVQPPHHSAGPSSSSRPAVVESQQQQEMTEAELFQTKLSRNDLIELRDGQWVGNAVMDAHLRQLTSRHTTLGYVPTYVITTYRHALEKREANRFAVGWPQRTNIEGVQFWFIPAFLLRRYKNFLDEIIVADHWCMAVLDVKTRTLAVYDSMHPGGEEDDKKAFVLDVIEFFKEFYAIKGTSLNIYSAWNSVTSVPRQLNGDDCGVFALMCATSVATAGKLEPNFEFSQNVMPWLRNTLFELLWRQNFGDLPRLAAAGEQQQQGDGGKKQISSAQLEQIAQPTKQISSAQLEQMAQPKKQLSSAQLEQMAQPKKQLSSAQLEQMAQPKKQLSSAQLEQMAQPKKQLSSAQLEQMAQPKKQLSSAQLEQMITDDKGKQKVSQQQLETIIEGLQKPISSEQLETLAKEGMSKIASSQPLKKIKKDKGKRLSTKEFELLVREALKSGPLHPPIKEEIEFNGYHYHHERTRDAEGGGGHYRSYYKCSDRFGEDKCPGRAASFSGVMTTTADHKPVCKGIMDETFQRPIKHIASISLEQLKQMVQAQKQHSSAQLEQIVQLQKQHSLAQLEQMAQKKPVSSAQLEQMVAQPKKALSSAQLEQMAQPKKQLSSAQLEQMAQKKPLSSAQLEQMVAQPKKALSSAQLEQMAQPKKQLSSAQLEQMAQPKKQLSSAQLEQMAQPKKQLSSAQLEQMSKKRTSGSDLQELPKDKGKEEIVKRQKPMQFKTPLTANDLSTSIGQNALNRSVIDAYLELITFEQTIMRFIPSTIVDFYLQHGHQPLSQRFPTDWFDGIRVNGVQFWFIPARFQLADSSEHWALIVFEMSLVHGMTMSLYDSGGAGMLVEEKEKFKKNLVNLFKDLYASKSFHLRNEFDNIAQKTVFFLPQQERANDCGVFALMFAYYIAVNRDTNTNLYSQASREKVPQMREKIRSELVNFRFT